MVETAKEPLARYMDKLGQKHGYLVIFEKKSSEVLPWEQRIRREVHAVDDKEIRLVARGQRGGKKESFFVHTKAF